MFIIGSALLLHSLNANLYSLPLSPDLSALRRACGSSCALVLCWMHSVVHIKGAYQSLAMIRNGHQFIQFDQVMA
jgi:hypothetical protein